jgi:hypothetical protein
MHSWQGLPGGDRVRLMWVGDSIIRCEFEDVAGGGVLGTRPEGEGSPDDAGAQRWIDRWQGRSDGPTPALVRGGRRDSVSTSGLDRASGGAARCGDLVRATGRIHRGSGSRSCRGCRLWSRPGRPDHPLSPGCGARESGDLNGYRWGLDRDRALLAGEPGLELSSAPG